MSHWSIEFSTNLSNGYAWGRAIHEEFAAYEACLSMLVHSDGTVYLTIAGQRCDDLLVLDFATFWQAATIKRWGSSRITYRADYGGLFLAFPDGSCLERFEDCCDRVLRVYSETSPPPTLKDLQDLGVVPIPRVVGSFLVGLRDDEVTGPFPLFSSDSSVSSEEESDADSSAHTADTLSEEDLAAISEEIRDSDMRVVA